MFFSSFRFRVLACVLVTVVSFLLVSFSSAMWQSILGKTFWADRSNSTSSAALSFPLLSPLSFCGFAQKREAFLTKILSSFSCFHQPCKITDKSWEVRIRSKLNKYYPKISKNISVFKEPHVSQKKAEVRTAQIPEEACPSVFLFTLELNTGKTQVLLCKRQCVVLPFDTEHSFCWSLCLDFAEKGWSAVVQEMKPDLCRAAAGIRCF